MFERESKLMRLWWLIRWIEEADERKMYKGLPRGCWRCELLGLCRRKRKKVGSVIMTVC